jgi:recombination protein RecA
MGDSHVGQLARLMSQAMRKLAGALSKTNCAAIFINQLREKIGVMYGNPETTPGGRALKFYASVRIDVRKGEPIKDGSELIGTHTKAKIVKNKVAPPFKTAEFDIMYGTGISHIGEIIDVGADLGILKKSGAWFYYGETRLGQGRDNVKKLFEDNKELAEEIENKIMEAAAENAKITPASKDDEIEIMPEEPVARPRREIDIDIAVDE